MSACFDMVICNRSDVLSPPKHTTSMLQILTSKHVTYCQVANSTVVDQVRFLTVLRIGPYLSFWGSDEKKNEWKDKTH